MTIQLGDISLQATDSCNFCCCHRTADVDDDNNEIYLTTDGDIESHSSFKARRDPIESIARSINHLERIAISQQEAYKASTREIKAVVEGLRQVTVEETPAPLTPKIIRIFDSTLKALFGKR